MPVKSSVATVPYLFQPSDFAANLALNADFIAASVYINILAYGGVGDGVTDNAAALNAALATITGNGGAIFFPAGKYLFSSAISFTYPSSTKIFSLMFAGVGDGASTLYWPSGNGITLNLTGGMHSFHFRDLAFTTGAAGVGTAITANDSVQLQDFPGCDVMNCVFIGDNDDRTKYWNIGAAINTVSGVAFYNCSFFGDAATNGNGIVLGGGSATTFQIIVNLTSCSFFGGNNGLVVGENVQGVTVNQCNFTNGQTGINVPGPAPGLFQLAVDNSQFAVSQNSIIAIGTIPVVTVSNSLFFVSAAGSGIFLDTNEFFTIYGNTFGADTAGTGSAIAIGTTVGGAPSSISGNIFTSFQFGIELLVGSSNVLINDNQFAACTTPISNAGTNMYIHDNVGYNPVGAQNVSVTSNPFTYTAGSSPETVYYRNNATAGSTLSIVLGSNSTTICSNAPGDGSPITIQLAPNQNVTFTDSASVRIIKTMIQ